MKNKLFTLLFALLASVGFAKAELVQIADTYNMAQDSAFTLGAFDVVYVASFQNGANIYIKDESGYGVIYKPGYGLQAGDHVEAGLQGKANIYHGLYEVIPVSAKENLTITSGEAPAPMEATEAPTLNNVNQYVVYKNVTFDVDTAFVEGLRHLVIGLWNNQEIYFYNQYYIGATLQANKAYNIIAVNTVYGTVPQAYPVAVEEVTGEGPCTTLYGVCGDNLTWELTCDSVLTISGSGAMWGALPTWAPYKERIKTAILPDGIDSIAPKAFYNCTNLATINMPNSVRALGTKAFVGCDRLTEPVYNEHIFGFMPRNYSGTYTVPEGIVSIAAYAFAECVDLTEITLPSSVLRLGVNALGAPFLTQITCYAAVPPTCNTNAFKYYMEDTGVTVSVNTSIPVYVPAESLTAYQTADQWQDFTNILPIGEEPIETIEEDYNIVYLGHAGNELSSELVTLHLPVAPIIDGFSFLKWQVVAGDLEDGIVIQAVYSANEPSSAPEVYTNPANPAQKLIRNGLVYILKDDNVYTIHGQKVK